MLVLSGRDAAWHPFPLLPYARPHTTAPHTKIKPHKTVRFYSAIPIFQMHYCTFVIIGPEGDPDTLVAKALEPFDEQLKVAPYRKYLEKYEIVRMAKHYKLDQHNLHALAERLTELQTRLANLKPCYALVKDDLDASPICPHCNFRPQEETLGASATALLQSIDQQPDKLVETWTKTLLDELSDPSAKKSVSLLPSDHKKAVN
jgi:hypothetical protein